MRCVIEPVRASESVLPEKCHRCSILRDSPSSLAAARELEGREPHVTPRKRWKCHSLNFLVSKGKFLSYYIKIIIIIFPIVFFASWEDNEA